ncbi:MAG: thiamine pyrophosphate-dependent dehydrogenase E1 component subunit alpha [Nitrososphaerales archaeon]
MALTQEQLLRIYRMMLLIRRFEERATQYFLNGQIRGSFHPCIGQEATAVGAVFALRPDDYLLCTYRGHGHSLAKGLDPKEAMAELLGKRTGCSKGKGSSMHFTDPRVGLLGENAIVGAGVPIAAGAALRAQLDHTGQVAMTVFGDGALNQGALLEAFNLAAVWKLPLVIICENNLYSEMTPIRDMVAHDQLLERACGFGIPAVVADGYDPGAMLETTQAAVDRARSGEGPQFIEAMTYRLVGHMIGDSEPYRTKEEVAEWRAKDPVTTFPQRLVAEFGLSQEAVDRVIQSVEAEMADIVRFAETSPWPEAQEAFEDVWA